MQPVVKDDIKAVLGRVIASLKANKPQDLLEMSNHVIHDASIFQDEDSIGFAVLVYALYKTVMRCMEVACKYDQFVKVLEQAFAAISKNDDAGYRSAVKKALDDIRKSDEKLTLYIEEVLTKARIKKASKMHEHGLSIARTAELLGISQWELANYIGKTITPDAVGKTVKERIVFARRLFS